MKHRKLFLFSIDVILYYGIGFLLLALRDPGVTLGDKALAAALLMVCVFIVRGLFKTYRQVWRYAGSMEYLQLIAADFLGGVLYIALSRFVLEPLKQFAPYARVVPTSIMFWQAMSIVAVSCLATLAMRILYQVCYQGQKARQRNHRRTGDHAQGDAAAPQGEEDSLNKINVAIVGAGSVGVLLAQELLLNKDAHYRPLCFIDKDPQKYGNIIAGIRVYPEKGILERLKGMPVQEIIIALPDLRGEEKQRLFDFYSRSDCKVKLYDFPFSKEHGAESKRVLREFSIEDLLFRQAIRFDTGEVLPAYEGKTILVTGGGGSIGSELCRQLAKLNPGKLVIFDIYENNAYDIEQELTRKYGKRLNLTVEIGSVRDAERLTEVFEAHKPQIVFHAAAHKHVPLMEHCSGEAVKNNVFGTLNTVTAAERYGVEKFLLVSTDKAVNPTNVMGASKRLCEMIIQSKKHSATKFVAVRFGNVLGSNGSVIPLFHKQIAAGGPITLTDKRIIRYFMTIPEAAQLLLQTCAMASPGEIYVLDMGMPVKILDLAENMIRLSGLTPYVDIDIQEIGLRPGEKLYEELLIKTEELDRTENSMIFIERDQPLTEAQLQEKLDLLQQSLSTHSQEEVVRAMRSTVPTFHSPDEVNQTAEHAEEMKRVHENGTAASADAQA